MEELAADVERIEVRIAELRTGLADRALYTDAAGALRAAELKRELEGLESALVDA